MAFHRAHYVPDQVIISLVGDTTLAEARKKIDAAFGGWKKAGVTITTPDKARFRAVMGPAYAELRKVVGDDDWNQWQRFVEEGRKLKGS